MSGVIPPILLNAKMASTGAYIFYLFYANIHPHYDVLNKEKLQEFKNGIHIRIITYSTVYKINTTQYEKEKTR
jgi:hypothetical protein